ncbi:MAG: translation initiation factor IF-3 [Candidatus Sumerlaeia bacterium]|nr:translation initiation factor IF-3 [Candidatus Sumerlaeia bacterium]
MNRQIRSPQVRLVSATGEMLGVLSFEEALRKAEEASLDLVEVAPEADPPVCRIYDFKKALYDLKKKKKEARKKAHASELKEIKLRISIDKHDLETKLGHARKFFDKGDKVKFTITLRGREVTKPERVHELVENVTESLKEVADVEQGIQRMGRIHNFMMSPKKKAQAKAAAAKAADAEES